MYTLKAHANVLKSCLKKLAANTFLREVQHPSAQRSPGLWVQVTSGISNHVRITSNHRKPTQRSFKENNRYPLALATSSEFSTLTISRSSMLSREISMLYTGLCTLLSEISFVNHSKGSSLREERQ